ncbi:menaquinone-dependent protoporphyrinogen IX dehydrogenase [Lutibacter sp. TH_r2]|uniref:menaquinone-dependent protoporphyrinogen IX dehydrogenase n=1 Tax=Lutibacter sp. TH_r2 TaxID=3082083 RepID=UPI002955DFE8|nr:menaquinone-dependent protoporphyrinogen IX dehydrogenase [Lutibacter sp. TH_r2]MDV7186586.1 menaquinone-dependent protoporphyrinogen IX dehydrogenase [Lutibacter sp. TH_r2]
MLVKTGLIFATVDGQTIKIAARIKDVYNKNNQPLEVINIEDFNGNIDDFDTLIIGSSIRYGVHNEVIIKLIEKNKPKLDTIKTAFFSVNLVARKPEKNTPETNPYVVKFFKKINWNPTLKEVFAGMLDYKKYGIFDRTMIQFIMWITKGPTDKNVKIEYTNWEQVDEFAKKVMKL